MATILSFALVIMGHAHDLMISFKGRRWTTHAMTTFCKSHMTLVAYSDAARDSKELSSRERLNASYCKEFPSLGDWAHY